MRTLQLFILALLATAAWADGFLAETTGGAIVSPDPWTSGFAVASSDSFNVAVGAPSLSMIEVESMTAVFQPGTPLGDGSFAPGGSFMIELADGSEIQGDFSSVQYLSPGTVSGLFGPAQGLGGGAYVDFNIGPELAAFTGGAELFSGTLEVEQFNNGPDDSYIALAGISVPEPSTFLLLAVPLLALTAVRWRVRRR